MDITIAIEQIDLLKTQVQNRTHSYLMDPDYTDIIDFQLNGYIRVIHSYCITNNLISIGLHIVEMLPIQRTAIEFFCFWDGIKKTIVENGRALRGKNRLQIICAIAACLQSEMTKDQIDLYLSGFGVEVSNSYYTVNSKRIYVERTLRDVDGIVIMNVAKDLNLISTDVIETDFQDKLCNEFIVQQVAKCKFKMNAGDYDGAITNARTLVEEILLDIEEKVSGERQHYDGDLTKLYKRVSKQINMYPENSIDDTLKMILRGFVSIINGFSGMSNKTADRHATSLHPSAHHAKLVVNNSLVICQFLLESYEYQSNKEI